ncbi:aldehyde dehydrogenase [Bacteriovorax stolpii]|uniref:Aldehyde dehydrogenase n=1 Tax=Bacteriovorax stolpii TaxID=960 RepID=A0A2K9NQ09_BACTC|nr:aldehyde dehydrogenase family protein [Bacteriovorax stolpii]AUN97610.1 aldehyde dehydrogenase [Bacteriovorax stolpii]QDK42417.1 aldehyde dehydrogenase [Bacteriovorax stolpii]TDP52792.1 glyceraldehyde-3-phosphate dehydrogenase (NADP+) [Bacteriovorax stolpii]
MENRDVLQAKSFINNEWVGHSTTNILVVKNKFDQSPLATVSYADPSEVQFAIANSVQAFQSYSKISAAERRDYLLKIREGLFQERDKFINLIVSEGGKPVNYAIQEVERSLLILQSAADEAIRVGGEVVPMDFGLGKGKSAYTKNYPIGPILAISPFNFPLNLAMHKIAPALAVGCPVILKPSPYTPLTALALASLCKRVGLPAGVLNVVVCQNEEASLMLKDERLKMLSFTGSAEVGWKLKSEAGKKKVVLELGGNAAVIVDRTANLDDAAKAIAMGAYNYAGQVCISVQRIYVDAGVFDEFIEKLKTEVGLLKIGNPAEEGVVVGPMIDRVHIDRIDSWIQEAKTKGAQVIFGGSVLDLEHSLYSPTLLTNTTADMKIVAEEAFGPVAIIEKVQYFDEVIREINRSRYGLQAGLFTNQLSQMKYAHENLEVGALIINGVPGFRIDTMPYGGVKDSGFGREGVKYAMAEMLEPRLLVY